MGSVFKNPTNALSAYTAAGEMWNTASGGQLGNAFGGIGNDILGIGDGGTFTPGSGHIQNPVNAQQINDSYSSSQDALKQQQSLVNALNAQNGISNQNQVYNQLQGVANGQGPNPAQAMLNQQTGANTANQAALMAGQRGASANTGLMARQAAQQGANIQQQAVGQGATMQANQSLNALGQMGNISGQQVGNQMSAMNANSQARQGQQQMLLNALQGVNNANVGMQSNINSGNAAIAQAQLAGKQGMMGGVINGLGGLLGGAEGGQVPDQSIKNSSGAQSSFTKAIHGWQQPEANQASPLMAKGGAVPALVAPGERYLPPSEVKAVAEGKKAPMQAGEKIPGKAPVPGAVNDYANDIVPKTLETGGIVLPNKVTKAKDKDKKAAEFIAAILQQKSLKKGKK